MRQITRVLTFNLLVISLLAFLPLKGQESNWMKTLESDHAWVTDLKANSLGDIYVTGGFEGKIGMDKENNTAENPEAIYLAKFTEEGKKEWLKTFDGEGKDHVKAMDTDQKGNVYMAFNFVETLTLKGKKYTSTSGTNILLLKITPKGKIEWVKHIEGVSNDYANDLVVDHEDNFYLAGKFASEMNFGNGVSIKSDGNTDPFIAKFDRNCDVLWAKNLKSGIDAEVNSITVDIENNLIIAGKFKEKVFYDNRTTTATTDIDLFLGKINPEGKIIWLNSAGKCNNDLPVQLATDKLGNIIVGGSLDCETAYPETAIKTFNSNDVYFKNDMMIAKLSTDGELQWLKEYNGSGNEKVIDIDVDADNNVYFLGEHTNSISIKNSQVVLEAPKPYNFMIGKINPEGNLQWVERAGGNDDRREYRMDVDLSSNVYLAGDFEGPEHLRDFKIKSENKEQEVFIWRMAERKDK